MVKILLGVLLFVYSFQAYAQQSYAINIPDSTLIQNWIKEAKVPGIAVAFIENGTVKKFICEGIISNGKPVRANSIFDVASLTKTITTLLTLKLIENGNWNIDEPLFHYWIDPDIQNDSLHEKLTTRHILNHSSGFKNWRWMNDNKKLAFEFEPGSQFGYSGEGFEYLRKSIENKFNKSFENLADSLVFEPNNMKNTYLIWGEQMDSTNFAGVHDSDGVKYEFEKKYQANAADNLLTTIEDFANLSTNILNRQFLRNDSYVDMIEPQTQVRDGIDFGLGWIVFQNLPNDEFAIFNAGSDQGVNALAILFPKTKKGLVVFTNGDNGRGIAMKMIGHAFPEAGVEILNRF